MQTFDVASVQELNAVLKVKPNANLLFSHPVKSVKTIAYAFERGVRIFSLDTMEELMKILETTKYALDLQLLIRIDPEVSADDSVMPLKDKFGIHRQSKNEEEGYVKVIRLARKHAKKVGISFHVGSQVQKLGCYSKAIEVAADMAKESGVDIDMLDVGGGFPIDYGTSFLEGSKGGKGGEKGGMIQQQVPSISIDLLLNEIQESLKAVGWQNKNLIFEPGRAISGSCEKTIVKVEQRRGKTLYINDGIYGNFADMGPIFNFTYPMSRLTSTTSTQRETNVVSKSIKSKSVSSVTSDISASETSSSISTNSKEDEEIEIMEEFSFYGATCDSADYMKGPYKLPANIKTDDWIVVHQSGAYSSVLTSDFNGFNSGYVVVVDN